MPFLMGGIFFVQRLGKGCFGFSQAMRSTQQNKSFVEYERGKRPNLRADLQVNKMRILFTSMEFKTVNSCQKPSYPWNADMRV